MKKKQAQYAKTFESAAQTIGELGDFESREVTEYYSIPVLDLYKTSGIQSAIPVIRENYMPNELHPNDDGHKLLANRIIKFLDTL